MQKWEKTPKSKAACTKKRLRRAKGNSLYLSNLGNIRFKSIRGWDLSLCFLVMQSRVDQTKNSMLDIL